MSNSFRACHLSAFFNGLIQGPFISPSMHLEQKMFPFLKEQEKTIDLFSAIFFLQGPFFAAGFKVVRFDPDIKVFYLRKKQAGFIISAFSFGKKCVQHS